MKKEVLSFEEKEYNLAVNTLEQMGQKIKLLFQALDTLTGGEVDLITPSELDIILLKGTKFKNAEAVANLLGVVSEYEFYINNYDKVDIRLFDAPTWNIKQAVLDELKDKYTYYLTESGTKHFRDLERVAEILNSKPTGFEQAIQKNGLGYYINKQVLNNLVVMYERN